MKNKGIKVLFCAIVLGASVSANAQIYVRVRPVAPVIVMTAQPSPTHVWIGDEWNEDNGTYVYGGGYWGTPPHPGYVYHGGHWNHHAERGDHWTRGEWRGKGGRKK
ncbi:MAG TPA: hypothetical protein VN698_09700 [Bacteroidia bacterium]|nr:hypothetical protein [Bacteroidia bacterium]